MTTDRCDLLCLDARSAERIRAALPAPSTVERLARLAQSCSDPTRLAILLALDEPGELCVCDLTWIVGRSQNLVSHHLKRLREHGMVVARREAKIVFYRLTPTGQTALHALTSIEVMA